MPRPRRAIRDSAATKAALLKAGAELFAARGYDGVTLDRVTRKARVNKAMVSYHFGGKRGLYLAIVTATFEELLASVRAIATDGRPAPEQLRDFVRAFARLAGVERPGFPAMLLREVLAESELHRQVVPYMVAMLGAVSGIIRRGVEEKTLRPVDPVLCYFSLLGALAFFFATKPARDHAVARGDLPVAALAMGSDAFVSYVNEFVVGGLELSGRRGPARRNRR